jgi:hypothetical protein
VVVAVDFFPFGKGMEAFIEWKVGVEDEGVVVSGVKFFMPAGGSLGHIDEGEDEVVAVKIAAVVDADSEIGAHIPEERAGVPGGGEGSVEAVGMVL